MTPKSVRFPARNDPEVVLEGHLLDGGGRALVVSHPHPLAGGDMDHPVVVALWEKAAEAGFRSLRYNFRGVGASTGDLRHDSPLPVDDLGGAIDFMGEESTWAVGYSYGSRTTLRAAHDGERLARIALVGFPTRLPRNPAAMSHLILGRRIEGEQYRPSMDLALLRTAPCPMQLFCGDRDPLFEAERAEALGLTPVLFPGLNHFFSRKRGNQAQDPDDLCTVAARVMAFLCQD